MNYKVIAITHFERAFKRLVKKFPSLKSEYVALIESLSINPKQGVDIDKNCYKIRISIASKGKGKSGGARIITHIKIEKESVYLLDIFDKSEKDNISDNDILIFINDIV